MRVMRVNEFLQDFVSANFFHPIFVIFQTIFQTDIWIITKLYLPLCHNHKQQRQ